MDLDTRPTLVFFEKLHSIEHITWLDTLLMHQMIQGLYGDFLVVQHHLGVLQSYRSLLIASRADCAMTSTRCSRYVNLLSTAVSRHPAPSSTLV